MRTPGRSPRALSRSRQVPVKVVFKPVVTTPQAIYEICMKANTAPNCIGLIAWMHTFSPAKMWIAGLNALSKPFVHLHTQFNRDIPWADIDMDFMNLNQTAHGDREFGFICTRLRRNRKVIVGHWQDEEVQAELGVWARAAAAWHDAQGARVARFGDNMRQVAVTEGDKVEAQMRMGYSVDGYGVGDLVARVNAVTDSQVDALVAEYESTYQIAKAGQDGKRREALREAARIETGHEDVPGGRRLQGLHDDLRGPARPQATAGPGRPAADGRRLRLRRRRRLEDRRPGPGDEGHGRRPAGRHQLHGGLHLSPRPGRSQGPRGAHARGLPLDRRRRRRPWRSIPSASAARPTPAGWSSTCPAAPA